MNRSFLFFLLAVASFASVAATSAGEPALDGRCLDLLRQAKEPATIRNTAGVEHFRLIFDGTFSVPLIVHVMKTGDRVTLRSVLLASHTPDAQIRALGPKDWKSLTLLASTANFWALPHEDNEIGADGSSWVIEAFRADGTYQIVTRWTASYNAKERQLTGFVALGRLLARISPHKLQLE
jgi:hypothetical protein